jgi:hypothetical protein
MLQYYNNLFKCVCILIDLFLFYLQVKNKPHDGMQIVR